jgi:DNA-binding beta-propeller fold protein YncE
MRLRKLRCALNVGAVALVTGCSGASQGTTLAGPSGIHEPYGVTYQTFAQRLDPSGIDPKYLDRIQTAPIMPPLGGALNAICRPARRCGNLYVSDIGARAVKVLSNEYYTPNGSIFARSPDGAWADAAHNLYVANFLTGAGYGYIQENACTVRHCDRKPKFFYTANLVDPVSVTTDTSGNVYTVDFLVGNIAEFPQGVDRESASCALLGSPEGIAVDSTTGSVFVSFNRLGSGLIIEFPHGLAPCDGKVLGTTLSFAGGIILDPNKNLIVTDQRASDVDVIAPPYKRISRKCGSGFVDPVHVALTTRDSRLYVADPASASVQVYDYPACTLVTTLSGAPLVVPIGVTDSYNFVP